MRQDLVDQFESGQLADEVLRGVAKQASSQALTILQRMSDNKLAEGSAGMEALKVTRGTLAFGCTHASCRTRVVNFCSNGQW